MNCKRILLAAAVLGFFALGGTIFYAVFFTTPHMLVQENIRNFEAVMPLAPDSSLPLEEISRLPWEKAAPALPGPAPAANRENIERGATYYGYYCAFCHGPRGNGEGPVGDSYMPKPAPLQGKRLGGMPDRDLLRAMLFGTGHEPVLERVVPPEAYPWLVLFVRSLSGAESRAARTITLHNLKIIH